MFDLQEITMMEPMEIDESTDGEFSTQKVPGEIWLEIFEYLPYDDLLGSTLVCKQWNSLISKSANFTAQTRLDITIEENEQFDAGSFELKRSYEFVIISGLNDPINTQQILNELVKSAGQVWIFNVYDCKFNAVDFLNFCGICDQLCDVRIVSCTFESSSDNLPTAELNLLDMFQFQYSDEWILDYLDCTTVESELEFARNGYTILNSCDEIIQFLNRIEGSIDRLQIDEINIDQTSKKLTPKFRWNQLRLSCADSQSMFKSEMRNKLKLCNSSTENSKLSLDFDRCHPKFYSLIVSAKKINTLQISPKEISSLQFQSLQDLQQIKRLIMNVAWNKTSSIEPFLRKLVNLEELEIDAISLEYLCNNNNVQSYQPEIKTLELSFSFKFLVTNHGGEWLNFIKSSRVKLERLIFPKCDTLKIDCDKETLLCAEGVKLMHTIKLSIPKMKVVEITLYGYPTKNQSETVLLDAFSVLSNAQFLIVETRIIEENGQYSKLTIGGTKSAIIEKYFGNADAVCKSLALIKQREFSD